MYVLPCKLKNSFYIYNHSSPVLIAKSNLEFTFILLIVTLKVDKLFKGGCINEATFRKIADMDERK